jgi:hypothetical protein
MVQVSYLSRLAAVLIVPVLAVGCASPDADSDADADINNEGDTAAAEATNAAEEIEQVGSTESALVAPGCISYGISAKTDTLIAATMSSHCRSEQRVRMIWRWAADTQCIMLLPGASYQSWRKHRLGPDPYITELRRC